MASRSRYSSHRKGRSPDTSGQRVMNSRLPASILYRWTAATILQLALIRPIWRVMARRYGNRPARRFAVGMASTLLLQQALVGALVARPRHRHRLTLVDLMTLSRGLAASLICGLLGSGVRDRGGVAGWAGWLGLLYGAILCDWLDGPIARRWGTSNMGAILDREADSWLTLCTAGGAVGWGELPLHAAAAPFLRYVLLLHGLRSRDHADLHGNEPGWVRQIGIAQMLLFIAAMAPFRGSVTSRLVNLVTPIQTPIQLAAALELHRRRLRT